MRALTVVLVLAAGTLLFTSETRSADWPTYKRDAKRTAVTEEKIAFPLRPVWVYRAAQAPRPAWPDPLAYPTEVDFAYIRDDTQPVMLDFDYALHPVIVGSTFYFGSSADDTVRALSLATGKQKWAFVTGGPVRFAPSIAAGRLYVASDDGFVYCLDAGSGALNWKFRAAPGDRQVMGSGRMISRWPCRTGALVLDGKLYVTAGMWPAEGIFVYALDAKSGEVLWCNDTSGVVNKRTRNRSAYAITGVAPQGYLLSDRGGLVVPTGRSVPASFSCADGRLISFTNPGYQNKWGGPCESIDPGGFVIFGISYERLSLARQGLREIRKVPSLTRYSTMKADRAIVGKNVYAVLNGKVRRFGRDRRYRGKVKWQVDYPDTRAHCMALTADCLLIGGNGRIEVYRRDTGGQVWSKKGLDGHVKSIAVANGHVLAATDRGSIYAFVSLGSGAAAKGGTPKEVRGAPVKRGKAGIAAAASARGIRKALNEAAGDASIWEETSIEMYISDTAGTIVLHLGFSASGASYDGRWTKRKKKEDAAYSGRWAGTIDVTEERIVAEFAVPWQTMEEAGLDRKALFVRPRGKKPAYVKPYPSHGYRPVSLKSDERTIKNYTITLHFAELGGAKVGERTFDIRIQGKTVAKGLDVVKQARGARRALIKTFTGIAADRAIEIEFRPKSDRPPILSGIELRREK